MVDTFIEVLQSGSNLSMKNYGFICDATFFTCMHAHLYGWGTHEP